MEGSPALLLRAHAEEFKNGEEALHETLDANVARSWREAFALRSVLGGKKVLLLIEFLEMHGRG